MNPNNPQDDSDQPVTDPVTGGQSTPMTGEASPDAKVPAGDESGGAFDTTSMPTGSAMPAGSSTPPQATQTGDDEVPMAGGAPQEASMGDMTGSREEQSTQEGSLPTVPPIPDEGEESPTGGQTGGMQGTV